MELLSLQDQTTADNNWKDGKTLSYICLVSEASTDMTSTGYDLSDFALDDGCLLTQSGYAETPTQESGSQIRELREISGLTWEHLAKVFGVSRRTVHHWDSGNNMAIGNQEKLSRIFTSIQKIDTGNPSLNRKLILSPSEGVIPIDLLKNDQFQDFETVIGYLDSSDRTKSISMAEQQKRKPEPPAFYVGALNDRVHKEKIKKRRKKAKRVKKA